MTFPVIAIIGAGHMGTSLIHGLINSGHPADKLWVANPTAEKLQLLAEQIPLHTTTDNKSAAQTADVIIFAVKPATVITVAEELRDIVQTRKALVLSVATGPREATIQHHLGGKAAIVRAMPNTPALIGCGATALYANAYVTSLQHNMAESILRAVGVIVWLDQEDLLDTVTALSGCGPAYFFLIMEALQTAAEELGLQSDTARLLTLQTALGAARMAIESGLSLTELRHKVASPGGSTERGLAVLEQHHIYDVLKKTLQAAKQRAEELANIKES